MITYESRLLSGEKALKEFGVTGAFHLVGEIRPAISTVQILKPAH
jgi:hypothetical protein